ncbi:uncharacterized protein LOC129593200 [Paramacrobiotus metropolitanus]|uniref:uncharacterized protein LOC129593200 n=1 Tax=Paramacrobiotus metropolitanus TaxID=2943436 RepID=UPI002445D16A|nr:uncharacterized protein LOC129593200 [Paramacrobiotus metropolitanus]XP_055345385.1 uncharacterized protein LOC129593200 [Paramacrobiotus metropolitanus]
MEKLSKVQKATGSVLALSIAEVLLAVAGFAANFYNLFYGIFAADESVPMGQTLIFVISIPLYGIQVVCGARFMLASVRLLRGQRNCGFFGEGVRNIPAWEFGLCQIAALVGSGTCLVALLLAWFCQVGFAANDLIWSTRLDVLFPKPDTVAKPIPDAWSAVKQAFQADFTGQMVMLAAVLLQIACLIVVVVIIRQSKSIRKELKSATLNADGRKSSKEEHERLVCVHSKELNGPPPAYSHM